MAQEVTAATGTLWYDKASSPCSSFIEAMAEAQKVTTVQATPTRWSFSWGEPYAELAEQYDRYVTGKAIITSPPPPEVRNAVPLCYTRDRSNPVASDLRAAGRGVHQLVGTGCLPAAPEWRTRGCGERWDG